MTDMASLCRLSAMESPDMPIQIPLSAPDNAAIANIAGKFCYRSSCILFQLLPMFPCLMLFQLREIKPTKLTKFFCVFVCVHVCFVGRYVLKGCVTLITMTTPVILLFLTIFPFFGILRININLFLCLTFFCVIFFILNTLFY